MRHLIRFLHIPKTAGSTFTDILKRQYWPGTFFEFSGNLQEDKMRFSLLSEDEKSRIRLFIGHAPFYTGIVMADEAILISFLREPVSRVMSFCQHVYEGKSPYLRERFLPESFNLDAFLNSGNAELSNLQTKMLIGDYDLYESIDRRFFSARSIVNKALDNLFNQVFCYGLTEYFDESLIMFANNLNWKMPFYFYYRRNVKHLKRRLTFQDMHIHIIRELNKLDIAVYEAAKYKFLEYLQSNLFDSRKLILYRYFNLFLGSIYQKLHGGYHKIKKRNLQN